ncbi:hypothetical protein Mapa_004731 [Marchantia paleacea]|nr:hypothetical protein Mapa_004731 [Marchantia paleacea]
MESTKLTLCVRDLIPAAASGLTHCGHLSSKQSRARLCVYSGPWEGTRSYGVSHTSTIGSGQTCASALPASFCLSIEGVLVDTSLWQLALRQQNLPSCLAK